MSCAAEIFRLVADLTGRAPVEIKVLLSNGQEVLLAAPASHSRDFRSVLWPGQITYFSFTSKQAHAVKILWEAWKSGAPEVSEKTIQTEIEMDTDLRHLFRGHPAWGTMIHPGISKGAWMLKTPGGPVLSDPES